MTEKKLALVRSKIKEAELRYNRPSGSISLVTVSKSQPIQEIIKVVGKGQIAFGENYVQEAIPKIQALRHLPLEWHFIGKVQSNKTKLLAEYFSWIQSVTRVDIAELLNKYRNKSLPPLNICIEVNLNEESNKNGVNKNEILNLAKKIKDLPNLKLRGLMSIPEYNNDFDIQRANFNVLAQEFKRLNDAGFSMDTLSIGMSNDFAAAIAVGSTMVRIGTAIFGHRIKVP